MQVDKKNLLTLLSGYYFLHFFIATVQIGVIVQVCYTPQARLPQSFIHFVPSALG